MNPSTKSTEFPLNKMRFENAEQMKAFSGKIQEKNTQKNATPSRFVPMIKMPEFKRKERRPEMTDSNDKEREIEKGREVVLVKMKGKETLKETQNEGSPDLSKTQSGTNQLIQNDHGNGANEAQEPQLMKNRTRYTQRPSSASAKQRSDSRDRRKEIEEFGNVFEKLLGCAEVLGLQKKDSSIQ